MSQTLTLHSRRCSSKRNQRIHGGRGSASASPQCPRKLCRSNRSSCGHCRRLQQALSDDLPVPDTVVLHDVRRRLHADASVDDSFKVCSFCGEVFSESSTDWVVHFEQVGFGRGTLVCPRDAVCDIPPVRIYSGANRVWKSD